MTLIRVPYPKDPERREELFARATVLLSRFGAHEGTMESGVFQGSTPIGGFAGSYRLLAESEELEIHLTKKPWLVTASIIETQVGKFLASEHADRDPGTQNVESTS